MYTKTSFASRNVDVNELDRHGSENNLAWLARALKQLALKDVKQWTLVVLIGGWDQLAFRIRQAQLHLRGDQLPSYWSDCLLAEVRGGDITTAKVHYVPLIQPAKPYAPGRNGVVEAKISDFSSVEDWPNVALLAFPVAQSKVVGNLDKLKNCRDQLDALSHVIRWLAFTWGTDATANPIHQGIGLPSAALVDLAFAGAQLDISTGVSSQASSPEVIWATAKYGYDYVAPGGNAATGVKGAYRIGHDYSIQDDVPKARAKAKAKPKTAASTRKPRTKAATAPAAVVTRTETE